MQKIQHKKCHRELHNYTALPMAAWIDIKLLLFFSVFGDNDDFRVIFEDRD